MKNINTFTEFVNEGSGGHNKYWTKELCHIEALKYDTRGQFEENNRGAYQAAVKYGWLKEVCSHMKNLKKPNGYWTKERCHEEALKYDNRTEFSITKKSISAYIAALKNGWLDEICSHMIPKQKSFKYWTKEKCWEEALKYNVKGIFHKKSSSAYNSAYQNGWLDEICSHMEVIGSLVKRIVYAYEFPDNSVYVGLTYRLDSRNSQHMDEDSKSAVNRHMKKTGLIPELSKLTTTYVEASEAQDLEEYYVRIYKENGWTILNKSKPRGLGGSSPKWTYDKVKEEALKYNNRGEFQIKSGGAYHAAYKKGWLDEVCSHMTKQIPLKDWTKEMCKEEASKYKTKSEFYLGSPTVCILSRKNGWLDEFFSKK